MSVEEDLKNHLSKYIVVRLLIASLFIIAFVQPLVFNTRQALNQRIVKENIQLRDVDHIEFSGNDAYVFSISDEGISVALFKRTYFGWRLKTGYTQGDVEPFYEEAGFGLSEFYYDKETAYFGLIKDHAIDHITIDAKRAKTINFDDCRLWFIKNKHEQNDDVEAFSESELNEAISVIKRIGNSIEFYYLK